MNRFFLAVIVFAGEIFWGVAIASERQPENLLGKIVYDSVEILRKNGFDMPRYLVRNGASELPISSGPAKIGFFAYTHMNRVTGELSYKIHFYEADEIPKTARLELIEYFIKLHEAQKRSFTVSLLMMRGKYKKLQLIKPDAFIELSLNQAEH